MRTVFDYNNTEKNGFASNVQRIIIEDFNGDGIDDIFVPNASVALNNGKFTYKAINHVFISTGPNKCLCERPEVLWVGVIRLPANECTMWTILRGRGGQKSRP